MARPGAQCLRWPDGLDALLRRDAGPGRGPSHRMAVARPSQRGEDHMSARVRRSSLLHVARWRQRPASHAQAQTAASGRRSRPAPAPDRRRQPTEAPRARVRLVATGGTISNRSGRPAHRRGLVQLVPQLDRHARVESEQFSNVASSQLSLDQWLALARRLNALLRRRKPISPASSSPRAPTRSRSSPTSCTSPSAAIGRSSSSDRCGGRSGGLRGRGQPARRLSRRGRPRVAQPRRAGRAERRDSVGARGDEDRRAAARHLSEPRLRRARRRRQRPRRLLPQPGAAALRRDRSSTSPASRRCRASTCCSPIRARPAI